MDPNEDSLQMLIGMGFSDLTEIKRALSLSKNDLNEAVAILTNEQPGLSYDTVDEVVEMKDRGGSGKSKGDRPEQVHFSDPAPPSYDEAVEPDEGAKLSPERSTMDTGEDPNAETSKEFPATNLYELEGRVFTDQWSIPYKKEESLGKCLIASARFAEENLIDTDENCRRFVSRCMPEAIRKLMVSNAVHRWGAEIQEGIYNMLQLTVDLIAARLKHKPVPVELLGVLTMVRNLTNYRDSKYPLDLIGLPAHNQVPASLVIPPPIPHSPTCPSTDLMLHEGTSLSLSIASLAPWNVPIETSIEVPFTNWENVLVPF